MAVTRVLHPFLTYAIHKETASGNTSQRVKEGSTKIHSIRIDNSANAAASYLKFYNTNDVVAVGTTVPDDVIMVPASTIHHETIPLSKTYSLGVAIVCVTTGGTAGSTSPASAVPVEIVYE